MPELHGGRIEAFLNEELTWEGVATSSLTDHEITKFKALFSRIDPKKVEVMIESSKEDAAAEMAAKEKAEAEKEKASQTELDKEPSNRWRDWIWRVRSRWYAYCLYHLLWRSAKSEQTTEVPNWTSVVVTPAKYSLGIKSKHTNLKKSQKAS